MNSIPKGKWLVKVLAHSMSQASTGTDRVVVTFEDDSGRRIDWYGAMTDRALPYTLSALRRLGWRAEEHDGQIGVLNGSSMLVGARAEIEVVEEEWNGRATTKVKWVNRPRGPAAGALSPEDAAALSARLREKILGASARLGDERSAP